MASWRSACRTACSRASTPATGGGSAWAAGASASEVGEREMEGQSCKAMMRMMMMMMHCAHCRSLRCSRMHDDMQHACSTHASLHGIHVGPCLYAWTVTSGQPAPPPPPGDGCTCCMLCSVTQPTHPRPRLPHTSCACTPARTHARTPIPKPLERTGPLRYSPSPLRPLRPPPPKWEQQKRIPQPAPCCCPLPPPSTLHLPPRQACVVAVPGS